MLPYAFCRSPSAVERRLLVFCSGRLHEEVSTPHLLSQADFYYYYIHWPIVVQALPRLHACCQAQGFRGGRFRGGRRKQDRGVV